MQNLSAAWFWEQLLVIKAVRVTKKKKKKIEKSFVSNTN